MTKWEYCEIKVTLYREGSDPGLVTRELLRVKLPDSEAVDKEVPFGLVGMLNQLGAEGWELVATQPAYYLKRLVQY